MAVGRLCSSRRACRLISYGCSFILLAESTYAQAFMVLLNGDTPIGQFEVYQVLQDELKDAIDAGEGDYRIYIPVMPVIESFPDINHPSAANLFALFLLLC